MSGAELLLFVVVIELAILLWGLFKAAKTTQQTIQSSPLGGLLGA